MVLSGLVLQATPAAAASPVFSGAIPDLTIEAGTQNLSAYDFAGQFTDPDVVTLRYTLISSDFGGDPIRTPNPNPDIWYRGLDLSINGTQIAIRSLNASAWGYQVILKVRAEWAVSFADSNAFAIRISPPPVSERTWVIQGPEDSSSADMTAQHADCFASSFPLRGHPMDGNIVEYSVVLGRKALAPPPPSDNGSSPPPPDPYATMARAVIHFADIQLFNSTVPDGQTRVFLEVTPMNEFIANATPAGGTVSPVLNVSLCLVDGSGHVSFGEVIEKILRLPNGSDRSNLNPNAPAFSGQLSDLNLTAGEAHASAYNLPAHFSDLDGDPLSFVATPTNASAFAAAGLVVTINAGVVDLQATNSSWTGDVELAFAASDPFGTTATSNAVRIHVASPSSAQPEVQVNSGGSIAPEAVAVVVVVSAVAIVFATVEVARYALFGAVFGFIASRTKRPSLLDHFVRGQLYQIIKENPGIHFMEILRRSELANGTASHHLRVLEKGGLVRVVVDGTKTRFYVTGEKPNPADYGLSPADRQVLDAVFETPGVEQLQLAKRLGFSKSRVNRSVSRLALLGFLLKLRNGKSLLLYPRAEGTPTASETRPFSDASE